MHKTIHYVQHLKVGVFVSVPLPVQSDCSILATKDVLSVQVTGFSNSEEEAVGKTAIVPFLLEDKLKELGGEYSKAEADWTPYAVTDQRLVTGQNPQSSKAVAALMLEALK